MVVAPKDSVQMALAQKGQVHRDLVRRGSAHMQMVDPDFAPQHPMYWQLVLQVPHFDNFDRGWPVVADNFGKG